MKTKILLFVSILLLSSVNATTYAVEPSAESVNKDATEVKVGLNIGDKAPELKFNNPEGKEMALSNLEGKLVLIDFWASWCRPCRMENPNVVKAYEKYHDAKFKNGKGFDIYSVSLDRTAAQWRNAIKADQLNWSNHVSDLKFWGSEAAAIYRVRGIPTNVLIDKDGIILAKNLRGPRLHMEIDKHLVKLKSAP